jgi:16S rRNA (cytidine1402-2'-O)-methyltransferase
MNGKQGVLHIISTPIGNPEDITLRALRTLGEVAAIICEEQGVGAALLSHYKIEKPLVELNEHTENEVVDWLIERLEGGESLGLISDHGTPLVADPGARLVTSAIQHRIPLTPIPGASSIIAALVASGLPSYRFRFLGQLAPKTEQRRRELRAMRNSRETIILLDAPYRLMPLLQSVLQELGPRREIAVACNLTMPDERLVRGTTVQVIQAFEKEPFKGEFVLAIAGADNSLKNPKFFGN